ncbi:hypothetical protein [Chryseobacterium viscerum]|nr:hypothetical protein [Chryseobacterium viscerum]
MSIIALLQPMAIDDLKFKIHHFFIPAKVFGALYSVVAAPSIF